MIWLQLRDVVAIHDMQITEFGGLAGMRDAGALESALARPLNLTAYEKPSVYRLAASYAFGVARNHPFVDGNKRTALVAAFTFLELNGAQVEATEAEAVLTFLDLAAGKLPEKDLAAWLVKHCVRKKKATK